MYWVSFVSYLILLLITVLLLGYFLGQRFWREYKRKLITNTPFKKSWRKIIQRQVPYFQTMPVDLQLQLKELIQIFIAEKRFVGKSGINIDDEIKVTIAAQACLLLLNRKTDNYPKLTTIVVYPSSFIKEQNNVRANGVVHHDRTTLVGESWGSGTLVLSWQATVEGARTPDDGHNVVIHEFAHQLDQENGTANGAPILGKNQDYHTWSQVFALEFSNLQQRIAEGETTLFDAYGATEPAEFFAVASEVFFEQSHQFNQLHPELYQQLSGYYRVDPIHWQ